MEMSKQEFDQIRIRVGSLMESLYKDMDENGTDNIDTLLSEEEVYVLDVSLKEEEKELEDRLSGVRTLLYKVNNAPDLFGEEAI